MDLSALILESIAKREPDPWRNYVGCSSIGNPCPRAIWYGYHNAPSVDFSSTQKTTFDVGKKLEGMIMDYIEDAGIKIVRPHESNHYLYCFDKDNPKFQGHLDAVIMDGDEACVLEIKTAKSSRFQQFVFKGLQEFSSAYYSQLQSYIGMMGYKRGVILALNKDSSELHHEWVEFDPYHYSELCAKAEMIVSSDEPPERLNKNPTYYICASCRYKKTCFFDGKE